MDITIQRPNGETYVLSEYGIRTLDFVVSSPAPRTEYEHSEGRHGLIDLGTTYDGRQLEGSFMMQAVDRPDYALLRNEVFKIFDSKEPFYVIDSREPGKRWFVKTSGPFSHEQVRVFGTFSVNFISSSPFVESVGTTLDPFTFDSNLWQIGQGLLAEDLKYKHSVGVFDIYNAGEKIDPRYMDLVIEYKGASSNLSIKNETTGDEWTYTGTSNSGDVIKLDGVRSEKNGLSILRNTNKRLITLKSGWNNFRITGTSGAFEISFKFRFYYL